MLQHTPDQHHAVPALRALVVPIVAGAVVAATIVWLFAAALHDPQAHDLKVGLVAPAAVAQKVIGGLAQNAPGAFVVTGYASADEATQAIAKREIVGAFVVGAGQPTILVAGAAGDATKAAVSGAFGGIAQALEQQAVIQDARPLPAGDPRGLVPFFLVLGVVISGLLYQVFAFVLGGPGPASQRGLGALLAFAVADGLAAAVAVGLVIGFDSSFWLLWVVCGLIALAVATSIAACQHVLGMAGTGLGALVVVLIGDASSGGIAGPDFLPDAFRAISSLLPPGAGVQMVRSTLYFDGAALAWPAAVLLGWTVVALAVAWTWQAWTTRGVSVKPAPALG